MKLYLILFGILIGHVLDSEGAKQQLNAKCNQKNVQQIDKQMATLLPLLSGGKMPETKKQLQKYCASMSQPLGSAATYIKTCGGTFGPFMSKMMITGFKKDFNSICKLRNEKMVDNLLSAGKCANSVSKRISKCLNNMMDDMATLRSVPFDDMVNTGCCNAYKIVKCIMMSVVKSKRCDKNMVEMVEKEVLPEFGYFCGNYFSDNQNCNKLIAKTPKLNDTYVRPKSFFSPTMALLDSFRNMKCTEETFDKMDGAVEKILTIGTPEQIPENSQQLQKWCSTANENMPHFYGYIESCLSDFGRFLAKFVAGTMPTYMEPFCSARSKNILDNPDPQVQEYIRAAKCGNKAEDKIKVCLNGFSETMLGIVEAPEMSRIKMACCNSYYLRNCVVNATSSTKGCSAQTIQSTEQQFLVMAEGAINLLCNDLWGNDRKCAKLMADIPRVNLKSPPKSPFFPLIKMLDSFPDVDLDVK